MQTYLTNLFAHALVAFGGYFLFRRLEAVPARTASATPHCSLPTRRGQPFEPTPVGDARRDRGAALVGVIFFDINVGFGAFVGAWSSSSPDVRTMAKRSSGCRGA